MSKKAMLEAINPSVETIRGLVAGTKLEEEIGTALDAIVTVVAPGKGGGAKVNLEDVAVLDGEGNITHLLCSLSKQWLPVVDEEGNENFYTDNKSDKFGGFKRLSKAAESIRQKATAKAKATEKAVLADLLNPEVELSNEEATAQIEAAKVIDYSGVGSVERP